MVLFIMLYKVVPSFESVDEILKCDIQMKATEQYFPVILFIMLCKVRCFLCFECGIYLGVHFILTSGV